MTRISDKPLAFQALQQRRRERSKAKKPVGGGPVWMGPQNFNFCQQQFNNTPPEWVAQAQKHYWNHSLYETSTRCTYCGTQHTYPSR